MTDVRIVFPAPGIPGQNSVCLSALSMSGTLESLKPTGSFLVLASSDSLSVEDRSQPGEPMENFLVL
jgi:hypothetical protein